MRDYPHLLTSKKFLKFTGQQADTKKMLAMLDRHCRAVKALKKRGLKWNSETGKISPITPETSLASGPSPSP
jgi:hypothetical protein